MYLTLNKHTYCWKHSLYLHSLYKNTQTLFSNLLIINRSNIISLLILFRLLAKCLNNNQDFFHFLNFRLCVLIEYSVKLTFKQHDFVSNVLDTIPQASKAIHCNFLADVSGCCLTILIVSRYQKRKKCSSCSLKTFKAVPSFTSNVVV